MQLQQESFKRDARGRCNTLIERCNKRNLVFLSWRDATKTNFSDFPFHIVSYPISTSSVQAVKEIVICTKKTSYSFCIPLSQKISTILFLVPVFLSFCTHAFPLLILSIIICFALFLCMCIVAVKRIGCNSHHTVRPDDYA